MARNGRQFAQRARQDGEHRQKILMTQPTNREVAQRTCRNRERSLGHSTDNGLTSKGVCQHARVSASLYARCVPRTLAGGKYPWSGCQRMSPHRVIRQARHLFLCTSFPLSVRLQVHPSQHRRSQRIKGGVFLFDLPHAWNSVSPWASCNVSDWVKPSKYGRAKFRQEESTE